MTKSRAGLTELEGAVLGVIRRAPRMTPYALRRVFQTSQSAEWSGSAGAVYPAVARLMRAGLLLESRSDDRRGSKTYALSAKGLRALEQWSMDVERALGPGLDPFRVRAAVWREFAPAKRRALTETLLSRLAMLDSALAEDEPGMDEGDKVMRDLHRALLASRRDWLKAQR